MTTVTTQGREFEDDLRFGRVTGTIDTIAIGTGTAAESESHDVTILDEVYRSSDPSEVTFFDLETPGTNCEISLQPGQQIPVDTTITEMALIVSASNTMFARDTLSGITADSGHGFSISMEAPVDR